MKVFLRFTLISVLVFATSCSSDEDVLINDGALLVIDQQFNLDENALGATLVGSISATNVLNKNTLIYKITTSNIPFVLDNDTGELFVAKDALIDFESTPSYTFFVEVSNGRTTTEAQITVTINDLLESSDKPRLISYFTYLALRQDSKVPFENNTKWLTPMKIFISGNFTPSDTKQLSDFLTYMNPLFTDGFRMELVNLITEANTEIYFDTRTNLEQNRPDFVGSVTSRNSGRAQVSFFSNGEISSSKVWISTESNNRNATIKHELLHAIGFGHSDNSTSILFPVGGTNADVSPDDVFAIKALYHPLMKVGANANEIETALNQIL